MTAIVPTTSAQYALELDGSRTGDPLIATNGPPIRVLSCTYTVTTAGTGTVSLFRLPPGRVRIFPYLSIFSYGDTGQATADLDIGYADHYKQDGGLQLADGDAFVASSDIGGSAADSNMGVSTEGGVRVTSAIHVLAFNSMDGIVVTATVDTADADVGTVLHVTMAYQHLT